MKSANQFAFLAGIILCSCIIWMILRAETQPSPWKIISPETAQSSLRFIQNAGQWEDPILYQVNLHGGRMLFEQNRLTYHFYQEPQLLGHGMDKVSSMEMREQKVYHHVFRMEMEGANPQPALLAGKAFSSHHNYFLGDDPTKWAGKVPLFGLLTYQEIYPGIDLRFYGVGDQVKYEFLVHPGADPSQIGITFPGLDSILIEDGSMVLQNSVRTITELPPSLIRTSQRKIKKSHARLY